LIGRSGYWFHGTVLSVDGFEYKALVSAFVF
jgi:hypothetical protein